jgi:gluconolactonase
MFGFAVASAQKGGSGGQIERLDPAIDALIPAGAKLETIGEHFGMIEGPLWIQEGASGYLLFSDIPANVIWKRTTDGRVSIFLDKSGYTGNDVLNVGAQSTSTHGLVQVILLGSNGLTLDAQDRLVIAAHGDRNVARVDKDGKRTVIAERYDGKRFNGPNDVVVRSTGAVYFTDTPAGLRGRDKSPARELPINGFYLAKNGKVQLMDKAAEGNPNGIALSPDEKILYVGMGNKIMRYDIQADDSLANGRVLIEASSDGMKTDVKGNLWTTTDGGVWVMSPEGKRLANIKLPEIPGVRTTNLGFGDADGKTLYITARTNLYKLRVNVAGVRPGSRRPQ